MDTDVFERRSARGRSRELIGAVRYNITLGIVLFWGFALNWLIVEFVPVETIQSVNTGFLVLGYFVSCFFGIYLFRSSTNPWVSFAGYNFVVIPFGLVLNIILSGYAPSLVLDAMRITALVTIIMMGFGSLFPRFFEKTAGALAIALLAVVVVELVEVFLFGIHHDIIDWIVALVFCGYIGYDWGRANSIPKTVDNAVDSAAALYMDVINLFVRILRILRGRRR